MKQINLGKSDLRVSQFCLGTMFLGSKEDEATSYDILDAYAAGGGNFLDTANIYARFFDGCEGGESEALLGRWMADRKNRNDLVVASKVGFEYPGVERGLSAKQIIEECDKSLSRMGIEHIDLYYAHKDDRATPLEESLEAFNRLVSAGKVRYLGASNYTAWRLVEALDIQEAKSFAPYICIQQRFSYLRPRPGTSFDPQLSASEEVLDFCAANDFPLLPYSPLLGGSYTRADKEFAPQYLGADGVARAEAVRSVAKELGASANQVVLAWMLSHDFPVIPLVAASSTEQLQENLKAAKIRLSETQLQTLNGAGEAPGGGTR